MVLVSDRPISLVPEMVTWRDFTPEAVQAVLFTPGSSDFASGRAVATILPRFRERFDGEMQALPLPADVPAEIPRVTLQGSDGRWRLQMGPARVDCIWNRKSSESSTDLATIVRDCVEVLYQYVQEMSTSVGRIALVIYRVFPTDNPAQTLIKQFCNAASQREPFNRSEAFEIHNHKVYTPKQGISDAINSWVRCKSATTVPDNRPVILVEQDLNSLAQELSTRRFTADEIRVFFEAASREAEDILRRYFPEQEPL
jgi:hypothetical protein